jgi:hypothetical protein
MLPLLPISGRPRPQTTGEQAIITADFRQRKASVRSDQREIVKFGNAS